MLAAPAQAAPELVPVGDFANPTYATAPASEPGRVFVTERAGRVMLVDGDDVTTFLDLTAITLSSYEERGLLSMAFAPDHATSGRFYAYLTSKPAGDIEIREYTRSAANPDVADPASGKLLLSIPHTDAPNHNGGQLQIGPDGKLWLATGDGGGGNDQFGHSQDPESLLGKLIRLDGTPQVMARGLRNPWRFAFTPDGTIVIADVGQGEWEEIDVGLADNYGWPCWEGTERHASSPESCDTGTAMPVLQHAHAEGFCAIVGGYVVRDPGLPTLAGRYVYGDNCHQQLRSVELGEPATDAPVGLSVDRLSSFGEDACGRVLVVSLE
ncbi:MAG TPA: PQQ-dependent sugar dehydrogenase, partial [Solirubrobacter sp.]|nr:PQQ-dependent sugar dehydrogenase [Solirubrobacter sp.]